MRDLSVIIPARNEIFLAKTIENILENREVDTEVIAILDGYWPMPSIPDHPDVTIVHHTKPIGQRAATNEGVRISRAKFIGKCDAHCAFAKGFDRAIVEDCRADWTMIPTMHNLHAFNWVCQDCGHKMYQGVKPNTCAKCPGQSFEMQIVWRPNGKTTYSWQFDKDLNFQYWRKHHKAYPGDFVETMSCIGACFFMSKRRFRHIGGMDEAHGGWGNFGTELACKSWLSGGKMITTRKAWFAHMFRTGNFKGSGLHGGTFPYALSQADINKAKSYSRDYWMNNRWPKAVHKLEWLVEKFNPPGWA